MTTLTDEQIDAMPAGRALDQLVAERVMGWTRGNPARGEHFWKSPEETPVTPKYSTDISAAWEVVEKVRLSWHDRFSLEWDGDEWVAGWRDNDYDTGWTWDHIAHAAAETAPLAICRFALKAVRSLAK